MIKSIIIEDSQLARDELKILLQGYQSILVIAEAENADDAELLINELKPDLIFLDIHMPGRSGFELLSNLSDEPAIIFTTAYSEHAIQSFEHNTVDYLVKPINPDSLKRALEKTSHHLFDNRNVDDTSYASDSAVITPLKESSRMFIRDGDTCHLVNLNEISRFEVEGNNARVYFLNRSCLIPKSLLSLESRLPTQLFCRVNRQQIININFVESAEPWINGGFLLILQGGDQISVSRRLASSFSLRFGF